MTTSDGAGRARPSKKERLQALSDLHGCPHIQFDERMPVPPELLERLHGVELSRLWFPVIKDGDTVIIAAGDPHDPKVREEAERIFPESGLDFMVALPEDIEWFRQDFLHAKPGLLIGTERTGLAYWRNTLAHWRTRLACYRTDLAKARTDLAFLRWGLGLIAIAAALMRLKEFTGKQLYYPGLILVGAACALYGVLNYHRVRKSKLRQPGHNTLVEITAATICFIEGYHFIDGVKPPSPTKKTMLARLGDLLGGYSTILYPDPPSKERTHLARERNVLAAQRTVDACYRTIYARARTGLAFIRTGISFISLGLGLTIYFGISVMSFMDLALFVSGLLMTLDGVLWYLPVRKEKAGLLRCPVTA